MKVCFPSAVVLNRSLVTIVILTAVTCVGGYGQEVVVLQDGVDGYAGTADASLYEDRTANSNGGFGFLFVGATQGSVRRALIRFELPDLPDGAVVTSVQLEVAVDRSGPSASGANEHALHRVSRDWGEGDAKSTEPGGLGTAAAAGDATWASSHHEQAPWDTPGGDFAAAPSASTVVGQSSQSIALFEGAGMVADVQSWLDQPETNFGWIVIGEESSPRTSRRFVSSEGTAASRPKLTITYEVVASVRDWVLYR